MLQASVGYQVVNKWLSINNKLPFSFQEKVWENYLAAKSGLLNAPTGSGKTYALFLAELIDWINKNPSHWQDKGKKWPLIVMDYPTSGTCQRFTKGHAGSLR